MVVIEGQFWKLKRDRKDMLIKQVVRDVRDSEVYFWMVKLNFKKILMV